MNSAEKSERIKKRRESRDMAFKILFGRAFRENTAALSEIFEDMEEINDVELSQFTRRLVIGVENHLAEIDEAIKENMSRWTIDRIPKVSLTAMRLAVYEMLFEAEVPVSVSINEAVEIAKLYAADDDGAFVNAVLGKIAKHVENSGDV